MKFQRVHTWRKSSYSNGDGGACVEVATLGHEHAVRDSKNPTGNVLAFSNDEWSAFVDAVRAGDLC